MISVLLCTLNRPVLIKNCIESFLSQTYKDFEIIVVDQSPDDETEKSCKSFSDERIHYHKVDFTGLSRARNYGLKYCRGKYICLGDDDAVYSREYLKNAVEFLKGKNCKYILCGRLKYADKKDMDCYDYDCCIDSQILNQNDLMRIGQSPSLILPTKRLKRIGGFDEDFGVGSVYGSGEESDAVLRLLQNGAEARYIAGMVVYHGIYDKIIHPDREKIFSYYVGLGALLKKHLIYRHDFSLLPKYMRATLGADIKWITGDKEQKDIYSKRIAGFKEGFKEYHIETWKDNNSEITQSGSIPKIIHYCWLSDDPVPEQFQRYIEGWKEKLKGYEFIKWDFSRFDKHSSAWVEEAFDNKKYAFAADYIRLFAVYNYGGIYMDMDIEVLKAFDELLDKPLMMAVERPNESWIEAGCFGAEKNNDFIGKCLERYKNRHFIKEDGTYDQRPLPQVMDAVRRKHKIELNLYPWYYFTAKSYDTGIESPTSETYAIHHFAGSWKTDDEKKKILKIQNISRVFGVTIARNIVEYSESISKNGLLSVVEITISKIKRKINKRNR